VREVELIGGPMDGERYALPLDKTFIEFVSWCGRWVVHETGVAPELRSVIYRGEPLGWKMYHVPERGAR